MGRKWIQFFSKKKKISVFYCWCLFFSVFLCVEGWGLFFCFFGGVLFRNFLVTWDTHVTLCYLFLFVIVRRKVTILKYMPSAPPPTPGAWGLGLRLSKLMQSFKNLPLLLLFYYLTSNCWIDCNNIELSTKIMKFIAPGSAVFALE